MNNPEAPSEEAFQAYYTVPNQNPAFSWVDKPNGVTYLFDLSIYQIQLTPTVEPHAGRVTRANQNLWKNLPPELLETTDNWKKAWFTAAQKLDIATILFIIEQGFDVNTVSEYGYTALFDAVAPYGGNFRIVKLLVESGADLTLPNNTVDFLIKECHDGVSGSGEANEATLIEHFLRSVA